MDRKCYKCQLIKPLDEFYKNKTKLQGRSYECKQCAAEFKRHYALKYKDINIHKTTRKCDVCRQVKTLNEFHKCKSVLWGRHYTCKRCRSKKARVAFINQFTPPDIWKHEKWRNVPNYKNRYQVSKNGLMRSKLRYDIWIPIKPCNCSGGYPVVYLSDINSNYKTHRVHILVLSAFVGSCPHNRQASHLNGVRNDNRLTNLAWTTIKEICHRKKLNGTQPMGSSINTARLTKKDIPTIRRLLKNGLSYIDIAKKYSVHSTTIGKISLRKSWKHIPSLKENHLLGSKNPSAKLIETDIPVIKALWRSGLSQTKIAAIHGVCRSVIGDIIYGRAWTHVSQSKPTKGIP